MPLYDDYAKDAQKYKSMYGPLVLVVYEVGHFYEWYNCDKGEGCDVRGVCELLNVQATLRNKKIQEVSRNNPMLGGVPKVAFAKYVPVLLDNDYTVIIVSQFGTAPNFTRRVTEVLSKGTYLGLNGGASSAISSASPVSQARSLFGTFVMCIYVDAHSNNRKSTRANKENVMHAGCAIADPTTGYSYAHEINAREDDLDFSNDELHRLVHEFNPVETVIYGKRECLRSGSGSACADEDHQKDMERFMCRLGLSPRTVRDRMDSEQGKSLAQLKVQEHVFRKVFPDTGFLSAIEALDLECRPHASVAFAGLLEFVFEHNEDAMRNMCRPTASTAEVDDTQRLLLSYNAAEQLDLGAESTRPDATLCGVFNSCVTSMGKRNFRRQVLHPLVEPEAIEKRLQAVSTLLEAGTIVWQGARDKLRRVVDLERLFRKVALRKVEPQDFVTLDASLSSLEALEQQEQDQAQEQKQAAHYLFVGCSTSARHLRAAYQNVLSLDAMTCTLPSSSSSSSDNGTGGHQFVHNAMVCLTADILMRRNIFCGGVYPELDDLQTLADTARKTLLSITDAFNASQGTGFFKLETVSTASGSSSATSGKGQTPETETNTEETTKPKSQTRGKGNKRSRGQQQDHDAEDDNSHGNKEHSSSTSFPDYSYTIVATPNRCAELHKAATSRRKILWHGTESEFHFSELRTSPLNKTTSAMQHPVIERCCIELVQAERRISHLVRERFCEFVDKLWEHHKETFRTIMREVNALDFFCACARNAHVHRHVRPRILSLSDGHVTGSSLFRATQLRHPVVEVIHRDSPHVPNDVTVGEDGVGGVLLYGMNAAGKSCLMKAVALATVMAQAGMFVPCSSLDILPFNRIFTRIHSHDDMARGQSTFMVEMSELRSILKRCDNRSLVIGDEVCSGTESVSALSIVGASLQFLLQRGSPFLFATHLHELTSLQEISGVLTATPPTYEEKSANTRKIRICHLRVHYDPDTGELVFDRKLCPGQGPTVYGLEVCKALDMDPQFVDCAHRIRRGVLNLPNSLLNAEGEAARASRYNARVIMDMCAVCKQNSSDEVHHIRHQSEADPEGYIGYFHKNVAFNLVPLCAKCHDRVHSGEINIRGYASTGSGVQLQFTSK